MSDSFVTLWTVERCRWLERAGDQGPLEVVFGGPHISLPSLKSIRVGDAIYPVLIGGGCLNVVARLNVEELMAPEDFVQARLGIVRKETMMWDQLFAELKRSHPTIGHRFPTTCCDLAATGKHGSDIRFDRPLPPGALDKIKLGPKAGRELPLKGIEDGRMKNSFSLQGHVRRLSADSAAIFQEIFG